jgi:hypothetical protein
VPTDASLPLRLLAAAGILSLLLAVSGRPVLRVGHFSAQSPADSLPDGWERIRFGENASATQYDLVRSDSAVVLRARSNNGASGLITRPRIDLEEYPILEWRWKVEALPEGADVTKKVADDAAARLYVTFDYEDLGVFDRIRLMLLRRVGYAEAPSRAINYLWTTRRERGRTRASPYTDQIMMLPVRSGRARVGEWVHERRNVVADYREVFGENPPAVNGVAVMTDTDNTGGSAQALYGDIVFRSKAASETLHPASSRGE